MTTFAKIRLLLALLFASLLLTAVIIHHKYTPQYSFTQAARTLENSLHEKEAVIDDLFKPANYQQLKALAQNERQGLNFINTYTKKHRIWFVTLQNNKLSFWSGIRILPDNYVGIGEGHSFIKRNNGYYEAIKKSEGNFTAIAFILVKNNYPLQNKYLKNNVDRTLLTQGNLEIADFTDKDVFHIHDINRSYLFSVKSGANNYNHSYFTAEIVLWILCLLTLCLLISNICHYLASNQKLGWAIALLAVSILLIRFIHIYFHFPDFSPSLKLFNPSLYYLNPAFPSIGDLCLNVLGLCWFSVFVYGYRFKILKQTPNKITGYAIFLGSLILLLTSSTALYYLFKKLVADSSISFDVHNVLNLSVYSFLGVLMACFSFFIFYLLTEIVLAIDLKVNINDRVKLTVYAVSILLATLIFSFYDEFTPFYVLWGGLVLIGAYSARYRQGVINAVSYVVIILVCSLIASINLNHFESVKEQRVRKQLISQLQNGTNPNIKLIYRSVEKQIIKDPQVIAFFDSKNPNPDYLRNRLQKLYFDGYLSDYDFKIYSFGPNGTPIAGDQDFALNDFKDMVLYSSLLKVSDYFYRENDSFGSQKYFGIFPVYKGEDNLGTLVVEAKSRPFHFTSTFPELLLDNRFRLNTNFKDYSYAFYDDGHLLSQNGNYDYNVVNNEFKGELKKYVFKTTQETKAPNSWIQRLNRYNHMIYQPSPRKLIVVTRQQNSLINNVASLTFFFVLLLAFSACIIIFKWFWARLSIVKITAESIHWNLHLDLDRIMYKTRIQFSMIFAVVVTLALVGLVTFLSIQDQYQDQQNELISEKVIRVASKLETTFIGNINEPSEEAQVKFNTLAGDFSTDLTLFNKNGSLLYSTQPKIYSYGILEKQMNATAYIMMHQLQKSVYVNDEKVGELAYKAAYAPIRNSKNETVAYMQLPSFSDEADYNDRIGVFLNDMINIYALIFIAIGLFAVVVAQQITTPLSFIQHNLSKTIYGKKNEPIRWRRNDEIGALVTEYNKMIAALEHSANRLAQSERESAWREMAKQVAHEIKNPLTPLKLGLQLLEKSWKDKDPKFDLKFERFSKSFVEQIESLSSIASEFSAFAKMPDTRMEKLDIFETLGQAIIIFKHMDNISINFIRPDRPFFIKADRDQLLRCFNNLLKNAIEAMPLGRHGIIDVTYILNTNNIVLHIKDNGNGIPENLRGKIFEPNFTTKSSGTGLGLAFVKNSIENAGGKVWFDTATDEGTTFHLQFPISRL
ncbi:ATP-binding protein [Mucilaginibacter lacusdianchii]|uniref:ATP-binding protein n=1 Tax=Mucilaginibacter lacusdianchii TaxID=2684211 RepID=UPI00131D1F23|nr:ATP-binding protein [Mucilaginibacter sp. JXJ CY 39]